MSKEKQVQIIVRVSESQKRIIVDNAKELDVSINEYIKRRMLSDEVAERYQIDSKNNADRIAFLESENKKLSVWLERSAKDLDMFSSTISGLNEIINSLVKEKEYLIEEQKVLQLELEHERMPFWRRLLGVKKK
ncbi:plasmid mobilization protein [Streptococcus marmotae]|uniref:plasmid mobilization protein n=1 Tax=Streptococcus marmotae TaxID=1825069 RepID=UPI00082E147B|nr:hypothetical protein [Streptococcus marmotae]